MRKTDSSRTEYQEFLYSLFQKYEIEPNESWSNLEWKSIVDSHLANKKKDLTNFYNELAYYNNKNPSDQNWTHKIYENSDEEGVETKNKNDKKIDTSNLWEYTCVGCGETNDVVCSNCDRKLFEIDQQDLSSDYQSLVCTYCKDQTFYILHVCDFTPRGTNWDGVPTPQIIHKSASTDFGKNREFFYIIGGADRPWIRIKGKQNSWYWKKNKVVFFVDGKSSGEVGIIEDFKCQVSNGKHRIHLEIFAFNQKEPWTRSNQIVIEVLNSDLTFDWGKKSFVGLRSEGIWFKKV